LYTFENIGSDDEQLTFIRSVYESYKGTYSGNTFTFKSDGKTSKLVLEDDGSEKWVLDSNDTILIKKFKEYLKQQQNKLTESDIKNSVFSGTIDNFKDNNYGNLFNKKDKFLKLDKLFKKSGIESVLIYQGGTKKFYKKVTLVLGNDVNVRNAEGVEPKDSFLKKSYQFRLFFTADEKIIKLMHGTDLIGEYYEDRNLVILNVNPIHGEFDFKYLKFLEIGFKKKNTKRIALLLLTDEFFKGIKSKRSSYESDIKSCDSSIKNYGLEMVKLNKTMIEKGVCLESIKRLEDSGVSEFSKEIERVQNLPYVDSIAPESNGVKVTLKESYLRIRTFDRNKKFGERKVYMDKMGILLLPDSVKITGLKTKRCTQVSGGYIHPHASDSGTPCFDDGDFNRKIYSLLAEVKLTAAVQLIKIWLKECVNGKTHAPGHNFYDDRLRRGYPIFDGKDRVKLNEPKRLKTGEQVKLEKDEEYDKNIKRFKDVII
jgi:hypothetical protein